MIEPNPTILRDSTIPESESKPGITTIDLSSDDLAGMVRAFEYLAKQHSTGVLRTLVERAQQSAKPEGLLFAEVGNDELATRSTSELSSVAGDVSGIVPLDTVEPELVQPLWDGYIYLSKLNVLDGDPGLGKTTALLDIAARVTTGAPMPDGSVGLQAPAAVILLTAEDGLADTIRPRLDAATADLSRVFAITGIPDINGGDLLPVELPRDVDHIEQVVIHRNAALVIIDPLMAFLGQDTNSHSDQDVRRALAKISASAERTGAAWVVIRHLNKSGGGHAIYRGGGSIGIIGAARSGVLVAKDPDDQTESRRILASTKNNLGATSPALAFRIENTPTGAARIHWEGKTHHTANQLMGTGNTSNRRGSARAEAKEFLMETLGDGPLPAKVIERAAIEAGIAMKTLQRAKDDLKIIPERSGFGADGFWLWSLPESSLIATADHRRPLPHEGTYDEGDHLCGEYGPLPMGQAFCSICGGLCANEECRAAGLCLNCLPSQ